jgi:MoaA/NifB/PqqE/SkfB family radical SAM enzyme
LDQYQDLRVKKRMSFPDTAKASTSGPEAPPQRFPAHVMIEPSYACNLRCAMCPRHFDEVPQGLMKRELFDAEILPALGRFRYVSSSGGAEPTLNPNCLIFLAGRASRAPPRRS